MSSSWLSTISAPERTETEVLPKATRRQLSAAKLRILEAADGWIMQVLFCKSCGSLFG